MKKVQYKGRYHSGPSVCYKGIQFIEGKSSEVEDSWLEANKGPKIAEVKAKKKAKAQTDGDSTELS